MTGNWNTPIVIKKARARNLEISSLEIRPGCTLVYGPIGSGKTTLLRDILRQECSSRANKLLHPMTTAYESGYEIINLPAGVFLSGEPNKIPNSLIGESLGLFKIIGKLLARSPHRICPYCSHRQESLTSKEIVSKLLTNLEGLAPQKIILNLYAPLKQKDLKTQIQEWRARGYENIKSLEEGASLLIKIDDISLPELTISRLRESLDLHLRSGKTIEVEAILKDNLINKFKICGPNACDSCFAPLPRLRPSDFSPQLITKQDLTQEQKAIFSECALDNQFKMTGKALLRSSLADLKNNKIVFERLDPLCCAIVSNLISAGLGGLKITEQYKNLHAESSFYIQAAKTALMTGPETLILIDDPYPIASNNIKEAFLSLISDRIHAGGYTLLASTNPKFCEYATHFLKLGPTSEPYTFKVVSQDPPLPRELGASSIFEVGLNYKQLISSLPEPETILVDHSNLTSQTGKTILTLIKGHHLIAELLATTVAAKALGYSAKDILKLDSESSAAKSIRFNNLSLSEIAELRIDECLEKFAGVVKLRNILKPISDLGLGHVKLNMEINSLSLQERILLGCLKVYLGKPKNTVIKFQNLLDRLSEDALKLVKEWLKKNLGVTNNISSETVNPTT